MSFVWLKGSRQFALKARKCISTTMEHSTCGRNLNPCGEWQDALLRLVTTKRRNQTSSSSQNRVRWTSSHFNEHFKAWNLVEKRVPATNEIELVWQKSNERDPDHLCMCASYISVLADQVELVGAKPPEPTESPDTEPSLVT